MRSPIAEVLGFCATICINKKHNEDPVTDSNVPSSRLQSPQRKYANHLVQVLPVRTIFEAAPKPTNCTIFSNTCKCLPFKGMSRVAHVLNALVSNNSLLVTKKKKESGSEMQYHSLTKQYYNLVLL